jgi:hypothetical protein
MNFKKLSEPFSGNRISWRIGQCGKTDDGKIWIKALAYFDARDGMDRLDEVAGHGNWQDEYRKVGDAVICRLGIKVGDAWVWKEDASDETDIEAVKGGMSGAFKRACVKWGIGRYLYDLKEGFANTCDKGVEGAIYAKTKELGTFYWLPPRLPDWAIPENERGPKPSNSQSGVSNPPPFHTGVVGGAASAGSTPGAYVVKVGKRWAGMTLEKIGPHDAASYGKYLRESAREKGKPLTGDWLKCADMIDAFLATREVKAK